MKKITNILTIVLVLLIVVQVGMMFLPYFNFQLPKVKDESKTVYNMQEYIWVYCEEMTDYLEGVIDGYKINDYAMPLVGVNLFALVAFLFNIFSRKRGLFTQVFSLAWGVATPIFFLGCKILPYGNTSIQMACVAISFVGLAVAAARTCTWFIAWQQKRKALKAAQ